MADNKELIYVPPGGITEVPQLGDAVPRRGGPFARKSANFLMGLFGWKVEGDLPNTNKLLVIGAPHTSNWDWILVMFTAYSLGVRISWMAKHTLFNKPLGFIMYWLGGVPINRGAAQGAVAQAVESYNKTDKLILCITPEGTRKKVREWKHGFYHIAYNADVPIVAAAFDYGRKRVRFGPTFKPTGNLEEDMPTIKSFYEGVVALHPHGDSVGQAA